MAPRPCRHTIDNVVLIRAWSSETLVLSVPSLRPQCRSGPVLDFLHQARTLIFLCLDLLQSSRLPLGDVYFAASSFFSSSVFEPSSVFGVTA